MAIPNDQGKKNFLNEHFVYEVQGIVGARQLLAYALNSYTLNQMDAMKYMVYKNIALDNTLMHARNLVEFFFFKLDKDQKSARAQDYLPDWDPQMTDEIKRFNGRVNDEITHLGWARLERDNATKGWDLNRLTNELIVVVLEFIRQLKADGKYFDLGSGVWALAEELYIFPL
jgi:hypothetical protein